MAQTSAASPSVPANQTQLQCPMCCSGDVTVHYEHPCPYGWTHVYTAAGNVAEPDPTTGNSPKNIKCPGCGADGVPPQSMVCNQCGEMW